MRLTADSWPTRSNGEAVIYQTPEVKKKTLSTAKQVNNPSAVAVPTALLLFYGVPPGAYCVTA